MKAHSVEDIRELQQTINEYKFFPCPSIRYNLVRYDDQQRFLKQGNKYFWIYEGNFIDCDDEGMITVFALKYPNAVKKVCRIESR